jgi:hypothetical protein
LCESEVGDLEEGEGDDVVLDNRDQCPCCIESVGEEEEGDKIGEGLWEMTDFAKGKQNLFPSYGGIVATFGDFGTWSRLLKNEPPNSKDHPIYICEQIEF